MGEVGYLGNGKYKVKCDKCRIIFEAYVSGFNEKMGFDCQNCGSRSLVSDKTWELEMKLATLGFNCREQMEALTSSSEKANNGKRSQGK